MIELHPGAEGLLLLFVGAVAAVDLCTRRIPNALTLSGAATFEWGHVSGAGVPLGCCKVGPDWGGVGRVSALSS